MKSTAIVIVGIEYDENNRCSPDCPCAIRPVDEYIDCTYFGERLSDRPEICKVAERFKLGLDGEYGGEND
jgi:hypothetical protein